MTMITTFPVQTSGVAARSLWIDRIRVVLTVLVIFHHAAITYGASGSWFHKVVADTDPLLTLVAAVDQAFFMGTFFLLAGYLTPASIARKGTAAFLVDRLLRLGLPTLIFALVLGPLTLAIADASVHTPFKLREPVLGPMWFPAALLLFSLMPAVLPGVFVGGRSVPPLHHWFLVALAWGLTTTLVRQIFPVGTSVAGFQLGYFPGYLTLFAIGLAASRHRWLERLSHESAKRTRIAGLLALPILPAVLLASSEPIFETGLTPAAITYALWEPFIALAIIPTLIIWSHSATRIPVSIWEWAARNSYAAFILHPPLLVAVTTTIENAGISPLSALPLATALATTLSFSLAAGFRRSALVRRII